MPLTHELVENFTEADAAGTVSPWIWVGNQPVNAYLTTTVGPSAFNGTVVMETSFNQRDVHGATIAMTFRSSTANYQANLCVPWVRLRMVSRTSGQVDNAWLVARSGSHK